MKNQHDIDSMLQTNQKQKEFYNEKDQKKKKNLPSRVWSGIRSGLLADYRRNFNISEKVYAQHTIWLGDLSSKKILDLGCLRGNALSLYMAKNAKEYIGIDLSDVAIKELQRKIEKADCPNAKAVAVDFLSDEFADKDFDIIYAYGVLHHFENVDVLIARLKEKLAPNGVIISYDPLQTSLPIKVMRQLYRPFQSDKDWEWPFDKKVIEKLYANFQVLDIKGILGKSKYGILLSFLPLSSNFKHKKIAKMINDDWEISSQKEIYPCMHLTMFMRK
jgi:2-polyprenyl-3-methyl-5-hydroxy-6-metoxy-1,4-benzoquinol methylase